MMVPSFATQIGKSPIMAIRERGELPLWRSLIRRAVWTQKTASASFELVLAAASMNAPRFVTLSSDWRLRTKAVAWVGEKASLLTIRSALVGVAPIAISALRLIAIRSAGDFSVSSFSAELVRLVAVRAAPAGPLIGKVAALKAKPPAHEAHAISSSCFARTAFVV